MRVFIAVLVAVAALLSFAVLGNQTLEVQTGQAFLDTVSTVPRPAPTTIAPTTTIAPATTVPPTTTVAAPVPETLPPPIYVEPEPEPEPVFEIPVAQPAGSIESLICQTFVNDCAKALSVAWCESNHNPNVVGGAGERGLFQIHPVHIPNLSSYGGWDAMFNPSANIAYAFDLYSRAGWGPWTCA